MHKEGLEGLRVLRALLPSSIYDRPNSNGWRVLAAERVILATGFQSEPGEDSLLARVLADTGARTDGQGHIPLDDDLQIAPGLHVVGRAASLSLGPMAGNIKGARWAGERLAAVARNECVRPAPD